jgi:hypothetical protein
MGLREIVWGGMNCIYVTQNRDQSRALVNPVMNHLVSYNIKKFLSSSANGGFLRRNQLRRLSYILYL